MPIDATIPLGYKQTDPMASLSSMLDTGSKMLSLNKARQTFDADVARAKAESRTAQSGAENAGIALGERKALQQALADPTQYTGQDGKMDFNKALPLIMKAAPTTGMDHVKNIMATQEQATNSDKAILGLGAEKQTLLGNFAYSNMGKSQAQISQNIDSLNEHMPTLAPHTPFMKNAVKQAFDNGGQPAVDALLSNFGRRVLPAPNQQAMSTPTPMAIQTDQGTQLYNNKPDTTALVGPMGTPFTPPNQITTTPTGRAVTVQPSTGVAKDIQSPVASDQPPVNYPRGEGEGTWKELQAQRIESVAAGSKAGEIHDINRTIRAELAKGTTLGSLGAVRQRIASATGYNVDDKNASDYNVIGKMLARSTAAAASAMGPHTNAGLKNAENANGTSDYSPGALKTISHLNDALMHGVSLYNEGLDKAIKKDPNGVFAKRDFDIKWPKVATPQVLRLKYAVDNRDDSEIKAINKEVGGNGSSGARELYRKFNEMMRMAK